MTNSHNDQYVSTETVYCADGVAMAIVACIILAILLAFGIAAIVVNWP